MMRGSRIQRYNTRNGDLILERTTNFLLTYRLSVGYNIYFLTHISYKYLQFEQVF